MLKQKSKENVYVLVKVFQGVIDSVNLFFDPKQAYVEFEKFTGMDYFMENPDELECSNFSETKIFELELPTTLSIKKE